MTVKREFGAGLGKKAFAGAAFALGVLSFVLNGWGASGATVLSFSPEGTVKDVRQVRAAFSEPMVAFGDPRGADPFDIRCAAAGRGRWADQKNWVYDFDKDLPGGLQCAFTLKPSLRTHAGQALEGRREFAFDTGGPAIRRSEPWEGGRIDEEQIFILTLDADADPVTVRSHAYFVVEGVIEKVPARILERDPRRKAPRPQQVVLQAQRRFPPNAKVTLVWGSGVATPGGAATKEEQRLAFVVRPEFSAQFSCERENADAPCIPILPMSLSFTADVPWRQAKQIVLRALTPGYAGPLKAPEQEWRPAVPKGEKRPDDEGVSSISFKGVFPEKTRFEIRLPKDLEDDAGRPLVNASRFPLTVETGDFPPLVKFAADFGVLELHPEAVLPVTVRNVEPKLRAQVGTLTEGKGEKIEGKTLRMGAERFERVVDWLVKLQNIDREHSVFAGAGGLSGGLQTEQLSIRKPLGERAFEVIGIPLRKPGLYVVEFESERLGAALLGKQARMYVPAAALVTNLSVHFKQGRESSLAWVTTLDQARPVEGAVVAIRKCTGEALASARTDARGIARFDRELPEKFSSSCQQGNRYSQYRTGFYVTAEKGDDFSFVHSSWERGIESWRFNLPSAYLLKPEYASTVFDRTLFRAGETVHMKHFFRRHSGRGIEHAPAALLPKAVELRHQESNQSYELPLRWRQGSVAESTWTIPKGAKLGTYIVTLLRDPEKKGTGHDDDSELSYLYHRSRDGAWRAGEFRVEEFRVPLMRAKVQPQTGGLPAGALINASEVPFDLSVEYLAGGAAAKLPVQVRSQLSKAPPVEFEDFDGYTFANGKFREKSPSRYGEDADESSGAEGTGGAHKQTMSLDQAGTGRVVVPVPDRERDQVRRLQVELDYRDPNGETQTAASTVSVYPAARLVGVRARGGSSSKEALAFQVAVTDLKGAPVPGAKVAVDLIELRYYSHRKRLVGGFYSYETGSEAKRHGTVCEGTADEKGLLECEAKSPVGGNLVLEARTTDDKGNDAYAHSTVWIYDGEEGWFSQEDSDRIDLLPDRRRVEAGETARLQLRMPFREATALVTVEREGVIDAFVVPVSGKKPVIEVPIKPQYAPNVFVSALVIRGRVGEPAPTAIVDLGKPAYKLGIAELNVGWKPHELAVTVKPSKDVYQVRETGTLKVQVRAPGGAPLPAGSEVALAVVDEGLLQLKPNNSWRLLEAMMQRRGYEVETYTAQTQVIGKRHFGLKALPTGGDGGRAPTRELFDTLLYWNGQLTLDERGEAEVTFPFNDSVTGFRIAAVAHSGAALFGTGTATVRTTQDLMLLSGIPPLAREGDRLELEFTLRNTTAKGMKLAVTGKAQGLPDFTPPELELPPGEARQLSWPVTVPLGISSLRYELAAKDLNGKAADRLAVTQQVSSATPVKVYQATLAQVDGKLSLPVERPKDALAGRGGVRVVLDSTLLTGLEGVREYMKAYPYSCLEQRVSKAVALRDAKAWQTTVSEGIASYLDADGLARYFPSDWLPGSEILTAYVLAIAHEAGWEVPASARDRMLKALKGFVEGKVTRNGSLPTADLTVRKLAAIEALSRYGEASWALTGSLTLSPKLWPTSAVIDWLSALRRMKDVPDAGARLKEAEGVLRARLNFQGTVMGFSTESNDELWWMMVSTSLNANRFLLAVAEDTGGSLFDVDDAGRLARGALLRQRRGHWDTTTANAWGVLAMEKFARRFEKTPVAGATLATLAESKEKSVEWAGPARGRILDFPWPAGGATLGIRHEGAGKPWATIQSRAALPLKESLFAGYRVRKTVTPVERKAADRWSRGDIARVRLELEAQADMTWVVVDDPIPAGATILGSGLGNDSSLSTSGEKQRGWAEPAFQERAFEGYRAYYEYVPKGKWTLEYTFRFNQAGQMALPATRVEAMYAPEMFGELPNAPYAIVP